MSDFSIIAGDSKTLEITVQENDGTAIDLTGSSVDWFAAVQPYGTPIITKSGDITAATEGQFEVSLDAADTASLKGNFYHWAKITASNGNVSTVFLGLMAVSPLSDLSTVEQFKVRYPEFAIVSNSLISLVLAEAANEVGDLWGTDELRAQMLLAAHRLTIEGEPGRTSTGASIALTGPIKRDKVGDVETEFAGVGSGSGDDGSGYSSTSYGQEYLRLLRLNFGGASVALSGFNGVYGQGC